MPLLLCKLNDSDIKPYSDFTAGVMAQSDDVTAMVPLVGAEPYVRGDMIPQTTDVPSK